MHENETKHSVSKNAPSVSRQYLNALTAGLRRCGKMLAAYEADSRGSLLGDLYCRISYMRREKFLAALEKSLKKFTRADVSVTCSRGTNMPDGSRRILLTNAPQDGAGSGERLMINITGLDGGALIPMISVVDSHPTLEGVINATSDKPEIGSDPALDFLSAAAPLIAQWFRNLKNYAGYIAACDDEGKSARSEMIRSASQSISARQIDRLKRGLTDKGSVLAESSKSPQRLARWARRFSFGALFVLALLMIMGARQEIPVLSDFINHAVALLGDVGHLVGVV